MCRAGLLGAMVAFVLVAAIPTQALDRHAGWTRKFAKGPKATLTRATFFGGTGYEEFVSVFSLEDGTIAVLGNSWGPGFPTAPRPEVLGRDEPFEVPLRTDHRQVDSRGRLLPPDDNNPNRTGFMVFYSEDLTQVKRVVRFGWGQADISAGVMMSDGGVVVTGHCTENFRTMANQAGYFKEMPQPQGRKYGPYEYDVLRMPGDIYFARLSPDLRRFEWVRILRGYRKPPRQLYEGRNGEVVWARDGTFHGVQAISADGRTMRKIELNTDNIRLGGSLQLYMLTVNRWDGRMVFGGDHQSGTGREPWRKPILIIFNYDGQLADRLYDWNGPVVGSGGPYHLESDSSVRKAGWSKDGDLFIYAWSDGGNSVITRSPIDLERHPSAKGIGMSSWGAGVGSFSHLARFNPKQVDDVFYSFWATYMDEKPNSIKIEGLLALSTGETAIYGSAASWLVQTPNPWYSSPDKPAGARGNYVTVFNRTMTNALLSSGVAGCETVGMAEGKRGLVVASTCRTPEDRNGNKPPIKDAPQSAFGGKQDGHIFLLRLPEEN